VQPEAAAVATTSLLQNTKKLKKTNPGSIMWQSLSNIWTYSLQVFSFSLSLVHKIGTAFSGSDNLSFIWREKYAHHQSSQNLKIIEPSSSVEAEMLAPSQGHRTQ
jgi:cephalosporin hydroxylase